MQPKFLIAIDPGAKGAVASYSTVFQSARPQGSEYEPVWTVEKLAESPLERFEQLGGYARGAIQLETPRVVVLEDIGGYTGTPQPGSRMFTFGRNYGQLEGFLIALGYQIIRVRPQAWQKALSLSTRKGESKPDHKRRMRLKALDLFPQLKPTLDQADALLILYSYIEKYLTKE
jgi:hypothetical protein